MGSILRGLQRVSWGDLHVPRGSAKDIPTLLAKAAWGDRETGVLALDHLADLVCELGFLIAEATAATVPFLLELAGAPQVECKAEVLRLLRNIYVSQVWSDGAAAAAPRYVGNFVRQAQWEADAHRAVLAGRQVVQQLANCVDPDVAEAAAKLSGAFTQEGGRA
jgi:hypothetical protein